MPKRSRNARPPICGGSPLASPTPRLIDGSRKKIGRSWAWMSVRWTRVTLPSGSKARRSPCASRCCAKARLHPFGRTAAAAAAIWRKSRREVIFASWTNGAHPGRSEAKSRVASAAGGAVGSRIDPSDRPGRPPRISSSGDRDLLLGRDLRAVVVDPGEGEGAALLGLELELHVGIGRDRRLEVGREERLAVELDGELVDDLARNDRAGAVAALPRLHDVRNEGLDLDEVALLGGLLVEADAGLHVCHGKNPVPVRGRAPGASAAAAADRDLDELRVGENRAVVHLGEGNDVLRLGETDAGVRLGDAAQRRQAEVDDAGARVLVRHDEDLGDV